jgi:uncharacterized protein with HEPN domain
VSAPSRGDAQRIADILEHLESIRAELRAGKDAFFGDERAQKIVAYDLTVIGEAASKVSRATQAAYPRIPWTDLVEYRNDLIHEYAALGLRETWNFARDELPGIERRLKSARVRLGLR